MPPATPHGGHQQQQSRRGRTTVVYTGLQRRTHHHPQCAHCMSTDTGRGGAGQMAQTLGVLSLLELPLRSSQAAPALQEAAEAWPRERRAAATLRDYAQVESSVL